MNKPKRAIISVVAGATIFGGVYGLAASLTMTTDTLGANQNVVAACQAGAMVATYQPTYVAATPGYNAATVTVTGLATTCYSKTFKVTLSGAAGASLGEGTGTTPSSGTTFVATLSSVSAASVTGVAVVLEG